jgi:hypothetical protein
MVDARVRIGLALVAVGFILLCVSLPQLDPKPSTQPWRADGLHPLAALAWSNARCGTEMSPRASTPKLQADDLLEMTARFDETEQQDGREAACATAISLAADVSEADELSTNETAHARLLAQSR